jgi:hypothetical protein
MHAGIGRSEETTLLEIVQILRKLWEKKRGDTPVIFVDDAHLLGDTQLLLDKDARADLQLLLEIAWAGFGFVIMGTSEEAGAEVLRDQGKKTLDIAIVFSVRLHRRTPSGQFILHQLNLQTEQLRNYSAPSLCPKPLPSVFLETFHSRKRTLLGQSAHRLKRFSSADCRCIRGSADLSLDGRKAFQPLYVDETFPGKPQTVTSLNLTLQMQKW